jgi:hypothetical protein
VRLTFQNLFFQVQRVLLQRGVRASVVRADGYGSEFDGSRPPARARGDQHVHNRRVTFNMIQEIKIQGNIQFGAMSRCLK